MKILKRFRKIKEMEKKLEETEKSVKQLKCQHVGKIITDNLYFTIPTYTYGSTPTKEKRQWKYTYFLRCEKCGFETKNFGFTQYMKIKLKTAEQQLIKMAKEVDEYCEYMSEDEN